MRRFTVVLIVVVLAVTAAPSSAWAASMVEARSLRLTGSFDGRSVHNPGEPCGGVALMDYTGAFYLDQRREHNGYYDMDVCITLDRDRAMWFLSGTFVITSARGVVLRGTVSGTTDIVDVFIRLTVTESSGEPYPVRGTVDIDTTYGGLYDDAHRGTFVTALHHVR